MQHTVYKPNQKVIQLSTMLDDFLLFDLYEWLSTTHEYLNKSGSFILRHFKETSTEVERLVI